MMYAIAAGRTALYAHPAPAALPALPGRAERGRVLARLLERGLRHHPVLTFAGSLAAMGAGMVAAVTLAASILVLPLALLLEWV